VWVFYRAPKRILLLSSSREADCHRREGAEPGLGGDAAQGEGISEDDRSCSIWRQAAEDALLKGDADAIFLMGDSATRETMREMLHSSDVRIFDWRAGRRLRASVPYLTKIDLLRLDRSREEYASETLTWSRPRRADRALESAPGPFRHLDRSSARSARRATLVQKAGEFPAPLEHEYRERRPSATTNQARPSRTSTCRSGLRAWSIRPGPAVAMRCCSSRFPVVPCSIGGASAGASTALGELMALERVSFDR